MRVKPIMAGAALAVLTACSGGGVPLTAGSTAPTSASATGGGAAKDVMVNVSTATGQFTENFNPLVQGVPNLTGTWGMIYEPLMFFNQSKSGDVQPMLATKYEFGDDGKSLTFTLREGVKWSDGKPFTAEDVAFNFLYRRDKKDLNAAGSNIKDAQVLSPTQVKIIFTERMYTKLSDVAGAPTYMVPKHIWEKIDKPSKETNTKPVGTGPFIMGEFTPQSYTLLKNPLHWDTGKPKIAGLRFWTYNNNDASMQALVAGQLDWAGMFMPEPDKQFVAKDPQHNQYKNEAHLYITNLIPNLTKAPLNDLAVRQAVNVALDRDKIIDLAFAGLGKPVSPLGLVLPLFQDYVSPKYASLKLEHNPDKARQLLEAAGYAKGGDGYYAKDGKRLSITCHLVTGWTDYISAAQVMKQQLKEVGIEFKAKEVSFNAFVDIQQKGDFQAMLWNAWGGPLPFQMYNNILNSKSVPPANQNMARYKNQAVDDALELVANTPPEQADTIKQALYTIQDAVVADLPYIPLQQSSSLAEFRTTNVTGWPSEQNPYALGLPFSHPDNGIVAKNLQPAQ